MRLKWITTTTVVLMAGLVYVGWKHSTQPAVRESQTAQAMPPDAGATMGNEPADPGLQWNTPTRWSSKGGSLMRIATYTIPGEDRSLPAQCAVYYFGPGQGGTPEANIERWLAEFENPRNSQRSTQTVHGLRVSRARVRGAYQSHGGAVAQKPGGKGEHSDQQLLGAIVEGPNGPVFFKLTGPSTAVDRAAPDFDRMIGSVRGK